MVNYIRIENREYKINVGQSIGILTVKVQAHVSPSILNASPFIVDEELLTVERLFQFRICPLEVLNLLLLLYLYK